jgi:hypothetical protein
MRILVVGSVPPPLRGHRASLLADVLRLRGESHDVEIVSLDPLAAAHRYLAAPGVVAVLEIGLLTRRSDAVIVQLEPGLPVRRAARRGERAVVLLALAAILRRRPDVTLRLHAPDNLPGGPGGRAGMALWQAAGRIEVGDETMRAELAGLLGPLGDRVSVATGGASDAEPLAPAGPGVWGDGADATASHVLTVVRANAAAERASLVRRGRLPVAGAAPEVRVPQWQWLPAPGAGVPDLGPILPARTAVGRRRAAPARSWSAALSLRRAAISAVAAAERRPATRPLALVARLALVELRGAVRRTS